MEMAPVLLRAAIVALAFIQLAYGRDPDLLQDFCVADLNSPVFINGLPCKNPSLTTSEDFYSSSLNTPGSTANRLGFNENLVTVFGFPALNNLGLSIARLDFAPSGGLNPLHFHPRASEVQLVLEGTLFVGFVTADPDHKLFSTVLRPGDMFVYPQGMIHFQQSIGKTPAVVIAILSSQNPGRVTVANTTLWSQPLIPEELLSKTFDVDREVIDQLRAQFLIYKEGVEDTKKIYMT